MSGNTSEPSFLAAIKPEVAIISVGPKQNASWQHPRCATYQSLKDAGVRLVLQTELGKSDCQANPPITPVVVNGTIRIDVAGSS